MNTIWLKQLIFAFLILTLCANVCAQTDARKLAKNFACSSQNETAVLNYFANLEKQQKRIAEIERKTRERQIAEFGKVAPLISGHCEWGGGGCPVSLVKPYYPIQAIQSRIFGQIRVEVIADEKGDVIYARPFNNKPFLTQVARKAACVSRFTKLIYDDEAVKFKRTIVYNFLPE